ncbi:2,4-dichlorophenol 6-monooxygenase [Kribbella sandramycini]|uniref:2,4-dichlorophenol 6-monooxygenase n=1 Tax=Kribbella sandramycini TaxID=60450 RepID=A0A7Y4KZC5_9ACTN|nr:FAD-dependent monooxygenase [Kribbella sandramycini]MBB6565191.1 2,4-dichlorophenol 6-monooxygenase [Kribbella sandramycini]NOL41460.1 2,4-dichlorophenol 6-monooxygenase [Kribbella sandramycini]
MITTDVLIVGSGPAGGAAALFLSTYGVDTIVLTRYGWTANTPRAHITNQRTVELMRDMGIEDQITDKGTAHELMGQTAFCTSLAGEEIGRIRTWGTHPRRLADYTEASPTLPCDLPQTLFEPILVSTAAARGARLRFDTEYLALEQDDDGVTATVRDRLSGETYQIRAKYLIGADGGRSKVAQDIGLPMAGAMDVEGSMNIVFEADLAKYVAHRPSVLYWVLQPGAQIGGIGAGLIRMVRPWNEWLIVWGYDITQPAPVVDEAMATEIVRSLVGDDTIDVKLKGTSVWSVNHMYAEQASKGRVFCMGDAIHRHPPSNGLGSNTSIQDAYNLAWKLSLVLKGQASPDLLKTYDEERTPIAKQIVDRANKSRTQFGQIFKALGMTPDAPAGRTIESRKDDTPEGAAQREELRKAIELKDYEFNAHGVELGQRYRSAAVITDGTPEPAYDRDPELYYHPTTWPGARIPHTWLTRGDETVSTLDVVGKGRFTLLTGIGGDAWVKAAQSVAERLGVPLEAFVIGPGHELEDLYGDWARVREIADDGCLLVRPDAHIGYRASELPADPTEALQQAVSQLLGR